MQRRHRTPIIGCVLLLFLTSYYLLNQEHATPLVDGLVSENPLDFLYRARRTLSLDLSPSIVYSRRCIKPDFSSHVNRQEVVKVSESLIRDQMTIQLDQPADLNGKLLQCSPVKLSVSSPPPAAKAFPDLIFGMATSYERLREALPSIAHWAGGMDTTIVVIVDDWEEHMVDIVNLTGDYHTNGIRAIFTQPLHKSHTTSQSHFLVLGEMLKQRGSDTKWFGLLDDDTFFPHLKPLSDALGKLDHTSDMYVGTLAEDFQSVKNFGLMAYGGAGAYLSTHLAKKLGHPDVAAECIRDATPDQGDVILRDCVYRHSKARFTSLPGLYQQDLLGDVSGFFESGAEPLNLHHWKSWYHEPVEKFSMAAKYCGDCFLQRWRFNDDTVLSNGYSITSYRDGLDNIDLDKVEKTWDQIYDGVNPEYEFTFGPLREKLDDSKKKRYKLVQTEVSRSAMKQLYLWKGNSENNVPDEVIELVWSP